MTRCARTRLEERSPAPSEAPTRRSIPLDARAITIVLLLWACLRDGAACRQTTNRRTTVAEREAERELLSKIFIGLVQTDAGRIRSHIFTLGRDSTLAL